MAGGQSDCSSCIQISPFSVVAEDTPELGKTIMMAVKA